MAVILFLCSWLEAWAIALDPLQLGYAANGKVDALIDRRNNEDVVWKKTR